jgi:hypothetical protein
MEHAPKQIDDTVASIVNYEHHYTITTEKGHTLRLPLSLWVSLPGLRAGSNIVVDFEHQACAGKAQVEITRGSRPPVSFHINRDACSLRALAQ